MRQTNSWTVGRQELDPIPDMDLMLEIRHTIIVVRINIICKQKLILISVFVVRKKTRRIIAFHECTFYQRTKEKQPELFNSIFSWLQSDESESSSKTYKIIFDMYRDNPARLSLTTHCAALHLSLSGSLMQKRYQRKSKP